jgi:hypothetical protein
VKAQMLPAGAERAIAQPSPAASPIREWANRCYGIGRALNAGEIMHVRRGAALAGAIIWLGLPGSGGAQTIYQKTDKFDGSIFYNTASRSADLEGGSFFSERYVRFEFEAIKPAADPNHPYALAVHTQTPDWVFIEAGPSLILKLDGKDMMPLSGPGSLDSRNLGMTDDVTEDAHYLLTPEELQSLAQAKTVEFRLLGNRQTITGSWGNDLLADAAAMANQGPALLGLAANSTVAGTGPATPQQHPLKLGIRCVPVPAALAATLRLPSPQGLMIVTVDPQSVADKAGLQVGDVLLEFDNKPVSDIADFQSRLAVARSGDNFPAVVWRAAAKTTLNVQF